MQQGPRLLTRRTLLALLSSAALSGCAELAPATQETQLSIAERLAAIRTRTGGRLGVHALDTDTGRRIGLDDTSRYAMASTFKLPLAAAVLAEVERRALALDQAVPFTERDLVPYAPVTSRHLAQGSLTVRELCAAIIEVSDNAAANLLLRLVGGPAKLTQFIRSLGDSATRLDRFETELNSNLPGDPRDTTTPRDMVNTMQQVLVGGTLSDSSRDMLIEWLVGSRTGLQRIRAGLPPAWKVGDKTGTGSNGAVNDIAIAWPPGRAPILMAIYMSESSLKDEALVAAHAEIAAAVARELTQ